MQQKIKTIIIDDEFKAIKLLKDRLGLLFPDIIVAGTFTDWKTGLEALKTSPPDILFLDISMPEKNGLDILRLFPTLSFQIIFVTAHSEYAVDAIKLSAIGYVLKPIDDYELSFALNKAIGRLSEKEDKLMVHGEHLTPPVHSGNAVKIGVPNLKGVDYLNADDILYFESVNKYTKIITKGHSITSSYNLGEFKKVVDESIFFQVHRSYIVNLFYVKRYEAPGTITMEDNMQIPIAKAARNDFMVMFSKISKTAGFKNKISE